ncbi:MAG: SusC/RagA family TonB-linked outer membrane protein [Marinifilaceae bacterium]
MLLWASMLNTQIALANSSLKLERVTIHVENQGVAGILKLIEKQSKYTFLYNDEQIHALGNRTIQVNETGISTILDQCFSNTSLKYQLVDNVIVIKRQEEKADNVMTIEGVVKDVMKQVLPGVTIQIKNTTIGVTSNVDGEFKLAVPQMKDIVLVFTFVGMEPQEVIYKGQKHLNIVMIENVTEMEEVVVKGIFEKKISSYTGSAVTATAEEMKKVGALNILQTLSAIDPSIRIADNVQFGSDPNKLPEITVRGENGFDLRSSSDAAQLNPNAPIYVLDGIEVTARQIYDMDINRVESTTILKDASATSLYGSRGANGVILITTKRPLAGKIRTTFNANFNVSTPDLRDYDLMNGREKLEFERLAGIWESDDRQEQEYRNRKYNERLKDVERGVDTYWLSAPLQTSVNQRYSLSFEGGGAEFRYGIDLRYDTDKGVMKQSGRDRLGLSVNFNYNIGKKLYINNILSTEQIKEKNSPYGVFSTYAALNPCDRIYDDNGNMIAEYYGGQANPLINPTLPNFNRGENTMIQDRFSADWWITEGIRLRGNVSYTKNLYDKEVYLSPGSVEFRSEKEDTKRGSYSEDKSKDHKIDGSVTLQLSRTFAQLHSVNLGLGANMMINELKGSGFTATGFVDDYIDFIGAATQFAEKSTPRGVFDKSKLAGFFANLNYGYDNRYFIDGSFRTDGSSKFGKDSRFAPFWSLGVAWNIHNEHFLQGNDDFSLKLRGSVGSTGSVEFSSDQALTVYYYNFSNEYNGIYGAALNGYGNPNLKWQNTIAYNAGIDLTILKNRIQLFFDIYSKTTDNLLMPVDVAPSSGFSSYQENVGKSRNNGWDGRLRITWIENKKHRINWSTTLAMFHNTNKIVKLSNTVQKLNENALNPDYNKGKDILRQYAEGRSQSALMLVESAGIDPKTGQEVFYKLDGTKTFDYDPTDKIIVGDMLPKAEGNISSNFNWGGFNLYLLFNYKWGGKIYNGTLATKVEGANPYANADRRALNERWKNEGDDVFFKSIRDRRTPFQTTRFTFDDNLFSLQTVTASYDLPLKMAQTIGADRLKVNFSTTDLFRLSTIKQERGLSYPFARTYTAGLSVTF